MEQQNSAVKQAYLNEFKGNLFEFSVGSYLARHYGLESQYLEELGPEFRKQLKAYERLLRSKDPELLKRIPLLAREVTSQICSHDRSVVKSIHLIGKVAGGKGHSSFGEGDIRIGCGESGERLLSIKLCKKNSFVNTKSGGIKSFIENYFATELALKLQAQIADTLSSSFFQLGAEFYQYYGLEGWNGEFDSAWDELSLPTLPGNLPAPLKKLIKEHYHRVIKEVYNAFLAIYQNDPVCFKKALGPLCGFSLENVEQVCLFHSEDKSGRYLLSSIKNMNYLDFQNALASVSLAPLKPKLSSFEILLGEMRLQIRVKPMNKFTQMAMKVNCSVRF